MKEGFYISAYVCIDKLQNIENIKLRHDQAIALWKYERKKLSLIRYWELERISGIKHHAKSLFSKKNFYRLLSFLLKEEKLSVKDIVGIFGTKNLEDSAEYREQFNSYNIAFHSIAHLLTSIFYGNSSPFDSQILAMALDAGPDSQFEENAYQKKYYAACVIKNHELEFFSVESPARLWSYSRKKFKMQEGSLMALASASKSFCEVTDSKMAEWLEYKFYDESARINSQNLVEDICKFVDEKFEKLVLDKRFSREENKISIIIKIINLLSKKIVERNIDYALNKYDIDSKETIIGLAGGFALNCPTNSEILNKYNFYDYQIPPCTDDSGIALGIGLSLFYEGLKNNDIKLNISSPYFGSGLEDISIAISKNKKFIKSVRKVNLSYCVDLLINDNILVWINENSEIGPRALGNRSLIASASSKSVKNNLNKLKQREWWRPVAPLVMDEYGAKYFKNYRTSHNMLLNFDVKEEFVNIIPAVVHLDGSARVQSVSEYSNSKLYLMLKEYYEKTQIPILCNTSLNDKGEPIINTVSQAIDFSLSKGLQYICINGEILLELKKETNEKKGRKFLRNEQYFFEYDKKIIETIKKLNPYNLNINELTVYYDNPDIFNNFSLKRKKDIEYIKKVTDEYKKKYKNGLER